MVRVVEVKENNGVAVAVKFLSNESVSVVMILDGRGRPVEQPNSRLRVDGGREDDIPKADYDQLFRVAGRILGKPRKKVR